MQLMIDGMQRVIRKNRILEKTYPRENVPIQKGTLSLREPWRKLNKN